MVGGSLQAFRDAIRVYALCRKERPDVIHLSTSGSLASLKDAAILSMARILRVATIVHYHMGELPRIIGRNGWEWKLTRFAMSRSDGILLLDKKSENFVRAALPGLSVYRIPNPIDLREVHELVSDVPSQQEAHRPLNVTYVGRLVKSKGIRELVKACALLTEIPLTLNLIGPFEAVFRKDLERLASGRAEKEWLRFHGSLERKETLIQIRAASIFALPSYTEGFPNSVVEAMALAKPIVATRVGAIPEMLDEGTEKPCGILVEPFAVEELRDAIRDLYAHPEKAAVYGARAQVKATSSYAMPDVIQEYINCWRTVAQSADQKSGTEVRGIMLVSPLPPPSGGIASWTSSILPQLRSIADISIIHVDTAVRWRRANDLTGLKRILGGSVQGGRDLVRIRSGLTRKRCDVLHLCTSGSLAILRDVLILWLARRQGVRRVIQFRMGRLPDVIAANGWEWLITRRAMALADTVLLLDQGSISSIKKSVPNVRIASIPNSIDLALVDKVRAVKARSSRPGSARRIVYAGQIIPTKGITELVEACVMLKEMEIELQLIGEVLGKYRRELESIARRRGDGTWLKFFGQMERYMAMKYIYDADLFALPSFTEGFPNVVLEAMALGKPIVATDVGAIPAMLDSESDHPCGAVIRARDVRSLHAAFVDLLTHPEKAELYGQRARTKATQAYSMERIVTQYVDLWRSVAGRQSAEVSNVERTS
jgi:glycosyltransferase involved in cell wall biosynthesis